MYPNLASPTQSTHTHPCTMAWVGGKGEDPSCRLSEPANDDAKNKYLSGGQGGTPRVVLNPILMTTRTRDCNLKTHPYDDAYISDL